MRLQHHTGTHCTGWAVGMGGLRSKSAELLSAPDRHVLCEWTFSRVGKPGDVAHRVQRSRHAFREATLEWFGGYTEHAREVELAAEELFANASEHGDGTTVTVSVTTRGNVL